MLLNFSVPAFAGLFELYFPEISALVPIFLANSIARYCNIQNTPLSSLYTMSWVVISSVTLVPPVSRMSLTMNQRVTKNTLIPIYASIIITPGRPNTSHIRPAITTKVNAPDSPSAYSTSSHAHPLSRPANHPIHTTPGNSFGPHLFDDLTANRQHSQFLGSICD